MFSDEDMEEEEFRSTVNPERMLATNDLPESAAAPVIAADFSRSVRPYIDLIDKLRREGLEKDIPLPSIVVVGDQSSGKSSVLEALSGVQLPRGAGIVTRCPLELRLKSCDPQLPWRGRIRYRRNNCLEINDENEGVNDEFLDPKEVEDRVRNAQDSLAGKEKGISTSLISLEITSPNVPDLTLIDLPGITRVAVEGQEADVSDVIKELIMAYIKLEATIILAVVPANVDIATTEALQLAKRVDKGGERTIGVVTKPDLVDRGAEEEMITVITNLRYRLKRGFNLVMCRGQQAIMKNQPLINALADEAKFFEGELFSEVPSKLLGMKNLSKKLTDVLVEHIQNNLPAMKVEVKDQQHRYQKEISQLGEGLPTEPTKLHLKLSQVLQDFTEMLAKVAEGETQYKETSLVALNPHKKMRVQFEKYATAVDKEIPKRDDKVFTQKVKECIKEYRGIELPRFTNYKAYTCLVKSLVVKFEQPAKECLDDCCDLILDLFGQVAHKSLGQYHNLERRIKDRIGDLVQETNDKCCAQIVNFFEMEELVYTQDRSFSSTYDAVIEVRVQQNSSPSGISMTRASQIPQAVRNLISFSEPYNDESHLSQEAADMLEKIFTYMNICGRRITDLIPMMILQQTVKQLALAIRTEVWKIASECECSQLLAEDAEFATRREALHRKLDRLQKAADLLRNA